MELKDDLFSLASEILRKNRYRNSVECNIAMEKGSVISDKDFIYNLTETPFYFVKQGIFEIISTDSYFDLGNVLEGRYERQLSGWGSNTYDIKGLMAIEINISKLGIWFKDELNKRISISIPIDKLPDGWKWYDKKTTEYQFGSRGVYSQGGKKRGKVFKAIMELYERFPSGISIQALGQNTGIEPERLRIEIDAINKNKKFIKLGLRLEGDGTGIYHFFSVN